MRSQTPDRRRSAADPSGRAGLGADRRVLEVARRIAIARLADKRQQLIVAGAVVEPECLVETLRGQLADPGVQHSGSLMMPQVLKRSPRASDRRTRIPVDHHAQALLKHVGVKARVAGGGLEPDLRVPRAPMDSAPARLREIPDQVAAAAPAVTSPR